MKYNSAKHHESEVFAPFLHFEICQAGQIEPLSGQVLAREPYVWHP